MSGGFAARLLAWHAVHGRHDLPWQRPRTPYRAWLSEIMLQQTQAATVIPYFERFVARFDSIRALAEADLDDVLALWSGLGYYARARNLHRSARIVCQAHGGELPAQAEALMALPGIGRSTAHAILAQAHGQRLPILDGNVRRVMARHAGVDGDPSRSPVQKRLWAESEARLPRDRLADYTQAIMDLGAGVCRRRRPACDACPVAADCRARIEHRVAELPGVRRRAERGRRHWSARLHRDGQRLLLERRPPSGIWGGLWCLPIVERAPAAGERVVAELTHAFSHFDLYLQAVAAADAAVAVRDRDCAWFTMPEALQLGLPQPIRTLLEALATE